MKVYQENLQRVRDMVLEEMAMMIAEPVDSVEGLFAEGEPFYYVVARYTGVIEGALTVLCQRQFADLLPTNLLGLMPEDEIPESDCLDSFKEFANVMSGNLLVDAFGEETVFELPHFEVGTCGHEEGVKLLGESAIYCLADGAPLAVSFNIKAG